jgi:hypothetical protein
MRQVVHHLPTADLKSLADVRELLAETVRELRAGTVPPAYAGSIVYASSALRQVLRDERELALLEQQAGRDSERIQLVLNVAAPRNDEPPAPEADDAG